MGPETIIIKVKKGIKAGVLDNTWMNKRLEGIPHMLLNFLSGITAHGWGNGYIMLPKDHPWYIWITSNPEKTPGNRYTNAYRLNVDIHGGITYGDYDENNNYWIGFDTLHTRDNMETWPREKVEEATLLLFSQALDAYNNPHNRSFDPDYHE